MLNLLAHPPFPDFLSEANVSSCRLYIACKTSLNDCGYTKRPVIQESRSSFTHAILKSDTPYFLGVIGLLENFLDFFGDLGIILIKNGKEDLAYSLFPMFAANFCCLNVCTA